MSHVESITQAGRKMKGFGAILALALMNQAGAAEVVWGQPTWGGNGCAGAKAAVEWNAERNELRVALPDKFALAGGKAGERVTCLLSVPVTAPAGKSLHSASFEFSPEAPATTGARFSLQAQGTPPLSHAWEGEGIQGDRLKFVGVSQLLACGASGLLRLNLALFAGKPLPKSFRIAKGTFVFTQNGCK